MLRHIAEHRRVYPDFIAGLLYLGARKVLGRGRAVRICGTPGIVGEDPDWYRASLAKIFEWAQVGKLRPILAGVVPWDRVSEAHQRLVSGMVKGKLLLDFS
jgi:NADPH:quinone reductase-like Zn-dependent oxidoreductase